MKEGVSETLQVSGDLSRKSRKSAKKSTFHSLKLIRIIDRAPLKRFSPLRRRPDLMRHFHSRSGANAGSTQKSNFRNDIAFLETKNPKESRRSKIDYRNSALRTKLPLRTQTTITQRKKTRMEALGI